MSRSILFLLSLAVALCNPFSAKAQGEKRITILYDAFGPPSSLKMDWGFAALIEYNGRRILFDTGNNAKIFEHNVNQLKCDCHFVRGEHIGFNEEHTKVFAILPHQGTNLNCRSC